MEEGEVITNESGDIFVHLVRHGTTITAVEQKDNVPLGSRASSYYVYKGNFDIRRLLYSIDSALGGLGILFTLLYDRFFGNQWRNDLTIRGNYEAQRVGAYLHTVIGEDEAVLISSPKVRTMHTADIINKRLAIPPVIEDENIEERKRGLLSPEYTRIDDILVLFIYYGITKGRFRTPERPLLHEHVTDDILQLAREKLGLSTEHDIYGESEEEFRQRIAYFISAFDAFLEECRKQNVKHIVLVSHKGVIEMMLKELGIQYDESISPASVTTLRQDQENEWHLDRYWSPRRHKRRQHT